MGSNPVGAFLHVLSPLRIETLRRRVVLFSIKEDNKKGATEGGGVEVDVVQYKQETTTIS